MSGPFDQTWRRFVAGGRTRGPDPGVRERWRRGRRAYAVWVARVRDEAVLDRIEGLQRALGEHIVPVVDAHLTLWVAGFPTGTPVHDDDVGLQALEAQASALAGLRAPAVAVGGACSFETCAVLEVSADLSGLRSALASAGGAEVRFTDYQPHLTLGRYPRSGSARDIVELLAPHRGLPPIPLTLQALELVELDAAVPDGPLHTRRVVQLEPT